MSAGVETATALSPTRRELLAATAATAALSILPKPVRAATGGDESVPFKCAIPQKEVDELRRRVRATRWPDKETVSDRSQGAQLQRLKPLVEYWGTDYDWRKAEAKLNALPQFMTEIDGLDIQFMHVRSPHPNAMPLIMTHGWPGSVLELLKIDRSAHRSHGPRRPRRGRLPPRPADDARLRLLRQADGHRLGSRPHRRARGTC